MNVCGVTINGCLARAAAPCSRRSDSAPVVWLKRTQRRIETPQSYQRLRFSFRGNPKAVVCSTSGRLAGKGHGEGKCRAVRSRASSRKDLDYSTTADFKQDDRYACGSHALLCVPSEDFGRSRGVHGTVISVLLYHSCVSIARTLSLSNLSTIRRALEVWLGIMRRTRFGADFRGVGMATGAQGRQRGCCALRGQLAAEGRG
eukprot:1927442-Pyramimonas_sp.AAC.1